MTDYVRSGQKASDEAKAKSANATAEANKSSQIIRPGEGMGLAGRIKAMKKPTATPTVMPPTPTPSPTPSYINSTMDK